MPLEAIFPADGEHRQAAQRDAGQDGGSSGGLRGADRVPERHGTSDGADQGLEVEERSGDLCGDPALPEREQGERQQRAGGGQRDNRQYWARVTWPGWYAVGEGRNRQRGQRGAEELDGGDRDRVAAGQQAALGHRERGGKDEGGEHQAVPGGGRTPAPAARGD